jgi:SPP1 gp7 family putative phage head morphogenesis protein
VKSYVTTRVAEEVKFIQTTTKEAIKRAVDSGIADGESMVKIAKRIREQFDVWEGGTGVYRSMMIARTEVHAAAGYGMHESARQSGVAQEKAWLDAGDDRVRPAHISNTAQGWIRFEDSYQNGAMFPGDGTDDINCRCVEMYRDR